MPKTRILSDIEISTILHGLRTIAMNAHLGIEDACNYACDHFDDHSRMMPNQVDALAESIGLNSLTLALEPAEAPEPLECPFCASRNQDGTLIQRTDAYVNRDVLKIIATVHEPLQPGNVRWTEYDTEVGDEADFNEFDDVHIECNSCEASGSPKYFAEAAEHLQAMIRESEDNDE